MKYSTSPKPQNRPGTAEGQLVGGNLKTIETLAGTRSDIDTAGKILFVEDTGEYLYSIDRMFWQLQRTGKLDRLSGLIVGGFKIKPDDPGEEFGRTVYDIVTERVRTYAYPVCFDFPVGHQKENYAFKYGVPHTLVVGTDQVTLTETAQPSFRHSFAPETPSASFAPPAICRSKRRRPASIPCSNGVTG
jgi:muramoyltetrapeptide carboxypeptidase